jgi:hypothetical protein
MTSSEVYFAKGWSIRLKNLSKTKAKIISEKEIDFTKSGDPPFELPGSEKFTLEIYADEIEVDFRLPQNSLPQDNNPIRIEQKIAPAGGLIEYVLRPDSVTVGKSKIAVIFLSKDAMEILKVAPMEVKSKQGKDGLWGTVILPKLRNRNKSMSVKAIAIVSDDGSNSFIKIDTIHLRSKGAGIFGGILAVLILLIIVRLVKRVPFSKKWDEARYKEYRKRSKSARIARFPLHLVVTPLGRYSISLAQIFFWTMIVIFAFVYVAIVRGECLAITEQMLILLGLAGTTAVASKAAAIARLRDVPQEYMEGIAENRLPSLLDFFSIGGVPNIFKFQIFAFTLLAGIYVLRELIRVGNFPTLGENLLTLMGISGGTYIANELATENAWTKIQNLIEKCEGKKKKLTEISELEIEAKDLIDRIKPLQKSIDQRSRPIPEKDPELLSLNALKDRLTEVDKTLNNKAALQKEVDELKDQIKKKLIQIYTESSKD